jgi:hypothetical protein
MYLINKIFETWMEAGYVYYNREDLPPVMLDGQYDDTARYLYANYHKLTHPMVKLIDKESIRCGTAYAVNWDEYLKMKAELKRV